jgi:hypothetical protein
MRRHHFRPCLDQLSTRIAPSTIALAASVTAAAMPSSGHVAPLATPTPTGTSTGTVHAYSEDPMDPPSPC